MGIVRNSIICVLLLLLNILFDVVRHLLFKQNEERKGPNKCHVGNQISKECAHSFGEHEGKCVLSQEHVFEGPVVDEGADKSEWNG